MEAISRSRALFIALVVGSLCIVGSASGAPFDAQNAAKVGGFKAVHAREALKHRIGVLVATNGNGYLPRDIVKVALEAKQAHKANKALSLTCTACLSPNQLAAANSPSSGQVLGFNGSAFTWQNSSAGDITAVDAGTGLSGGGSSGDVSLALAQAFQLPQSCASGQVAKSDGSNAWNCANDSTAPSGSAGGALAGTYRNPSLNVTGGDAGGGTACNNGEALTGLSTAAALTCDVGVYDDSNGNVGAGGGTFAAGPAGIGNTALGRNALQSNTTGNDNTASGFDALSNNIGGTSNTASGAFALNNNTIGANNSAAGVQALRSNTTGFNNTASGRSSLNNNTTGSQDVASGAGALQSNTTGTSNTASGAFALNNNTTGANNTALGIDAGTALTTGNNNIDIGANVAGNAAEANTIRIGNQGTQTATFLAGVSGTTTGGAAAPVLVDANGQLGTTSSSRRFKRDIHPLGSSRQGLMKLRPVSFRYKRSVAHGATPLQFGLIAEQVAKVYPNLVVYGKDGKPSAVAYQELPALELAQLQHEHAALRREARQNRSQGREIASLQRAVKKLQRAR